MEQTEFQIASLQNYTFRPMVLRAVSLSALATTIDLTNIQQTEKTYNYILEHLEVKIENTWVQVKQKNDYWPASLETNVVAVQELVEWFLENLVFKAFQKSSE